LKTASNYQDQTRPERKRTMSRYVMNLQNPIFNESIEFDSDETPTIYSVCPTDGCEISDVYEFATKEDAEHFIYVRDYDIEEETTDTGVRWAHLINGVEYIDKDFEYNEVVYYVSKPQAETNEK
jgi:hypothetical protein